MNHKDLRLGNLVNDHLGRTLQVTGLKDDNVYLALSNGEKIRYNIKTIQPIFITKEWLKSFGFKNANSSAYDKNDFHWIYEIKYGDYHTCELSVASVKSKKIENQIYVGEGAPIPYDIFYVHQIQNLYYITSGKELTIKD